jgi:seryl-tRNA synthetase
MHDIKAIRDNPQAFIDGWSARGVEDADRTVAELLALDRDLRAAQTQGQEAQSRRNAASKAIGAAMGRGDRDEAERLKAEVAALKDAIDAAAATETEKGGKLRDLLAGLKNLAADDVPDGEDESGNVEVRAWGQPRRTGPKLDHADLGEALGMLDFEAAARMSGARFAVLKGQLARLERAIGQFMLDIQTDQHGYLEVNPPYLVRKDSMFGTGQLPKFEEDLYQVNYYDLTDFDAKVCSEQKKFNEAVNGLDQETQDKLRDFIDNYDAEAAIWEKSRRSAWLIPTAEVSLTNLVREQLLSEDDLATPMRLTALTPCFRAEAGSAGRDTRGLIRQHQFSKVELVSITRPEDSDAEHERMTACAEAVLEALQLPYRRMLLCKGDMGFSARKTFDLEVWLPSQGTYREISSCSNCGDFQARRMDARFRRSGEKKTEYVHTLNGSGLAVGRTLVAIMENYQDEGGRISVPDALRPYMGGLAHVGG